MTTLPTPTTRSTPRASAGLRLLTALAAGLALLSAGAQASPAQDEQISTELKARLAEVSLRAPADLHFSVQDGKVHFTGWAHDAAEVHAAEAVALKLPGVRTTYTNAVRLWASRP